jgi:RND family efflux transporter MFP subunit
MNSTQKWWALGIATVIIVGGAGALYKKKAAAAAKPADPAALTMDVGPENIVVVVRGPLESGPAVSGSLTALHEARLRAEVSGRLVETLVLPGQPVRRGQVIARIDDSAIRESFLSARSAERVAQISLDDAQRDADRSAKLLAVGAVADRDLEQAKRTLAAAQAGYADAQSRLAAAQQQMDRTRITAPFAGIVSEMPVNAGDVVQPGTAIATVIDPASMRFEGSVPAEEVALLRVGAPVRFTVKGYPGRTFTGQVERVNPAADPQTRQVRVWVSVPNAKGALVGGLFAQGRVATTSQMGIAVPVSAVDERGIAPTVLRVKGGRAERATVALGARDPETDMVEITSGLAAGDTVLIGAAQGLTVGTKVRVTVAPSDSSTSR